MHAYLLDTNVVIEHLCVGILKTMPIDTLFYVSVITEAELFRLSGLSEEDVEIMDDFLSLCQKIDVTSSIARHAAILGRTRKTKLPDLLIAASALEQELILITKDAIDFKGIPGLKVQRHI